jgi:hypothetical protein
MPRVLGTIPPEIEFPFLCRAETVVWLPRVFHELDPEVEYSSLRG